MTINDYIPLFLLAAYVYAVSLASKATKEIMEQQAKDKDETAV